MEAEPDKNSYLYELKPIHPTSGRRRMVWNPRVKTNGGQLSALTAALTQNFYWAIKEISPLIYFQSWVGSWA